MLLETHGVTIMWMFLTVAFVTIAASLLIDKWLNITLINKESTTVEPLASHEEIFKKFDERINKMESLRQEFESLKLTIGLKNGR